MMKLPREEQLNQLVAMSQESVSRGEDAAPLLELIQLLLDKPDTPAIRPASSASSASRPGTSASTTSNVLAEAEPRAKSVRRQLTEKRNELRAMLATVNHKLESSSAAPSSRGATPSSSSGMSQAEIDALLRKAEGGGKAQVRDALGHRSSVASIL